MSTTHRQDIERLRYWQGQTLRSRDARDQSRFDARRRQLHNRALHSVDGVAFGLTVTAVDGQPRLYDVACGLAYDCHGRELVLQRPRRVQAPTDPASLILRWRTVSASSSCCEPSDAGCRADASLLLEHDLELIWSSPGTSEPANGIVLARFTAAGLDQTFRPRPARPLARPRLARGETVRGNTPWEPWAIEIPDGQGGITRKVVGVETYIDTTAAGFTQTPCYFASLESPAWDIAKAEFAPAFFPQVAEPTVDGFRFRLLMAETTRRRYAAAFGVARVKDTSRGVGEALQIEVDNAGPFQKGDAVALLRPRAKTLVQVKSGSNGTATLAAALEAAEVNKTVLAVGNFPRLARVTNIGAGSAAIVATFAASQPVKKLDVLRRESDKALAVIDSVSTAKNTLTVNDPFPLWKASEVVTVARQGTAFAISSPTPNGATTTLTLPASHTVQKDFALVIVDKQKDPVGESRTVTLHAGAKIDVSPALTAAEIAAAEKIVVLTTDITINFLKSVGMLVDVSTTDPFVEGDFVAVADNRSAIASITKISGQRLTLDASLPVKPNQSDLVAANWHGATTVSSLGAAGSNVVNVVRGTAVPPGAFVVRRESDDSFSAPMLVSQVSGAALTLAPPVVALARLDTLAVGVFPRIVTVLTQQAQPEQIQLVPADAGALVHGDEVVIFAEGAASATVTQVASVNGANIVLGESLGPLATGQRLAVINFWDRALLTKVNSPTTIEIDREIEFRERDVVGVLTHYADNSNPGWIERIDAGNRLVLAFPSIESCDGVVAADWIDGGVIGPASVSFVLDDPTPARFQPFLRLLSTDGLQQVQPAVAYGFDLTTGRFVSISLVPYVFGAASQVYVWPTDQTARYRYRPETLSLITIFNADFPRAFATFAQKQQLSVCWIGCQKEFPRLIDCPGQHPYDSCADDDSIEV